MPRSPTGRRRQERPRLCHDGRISLGLPGCELVRASCWRDRIFSSEVRCSNQARCALLSASAMASMTSAGFEPELVRDHMKESRRFCGWAYFAWAGRLCRCVARCPGQGPRGIVAIRPASLPRAANRGRPPASEDWRIQVDRRHSRPAQMRSLFPGTVAQGARSPGHRVP